MSKNFKQCDAKWKNHSYCKTTMCASGCGPTAVADIFYNFDTGITPVKVADWFTENGWDSYKQGTIWGGIAAYFNKHNAKAVQLNSDNFYGNKNSQAETNWKSKMQSGKYWGILLMGKSMWTKGGHYIAVTEYKDGKYYVMDPAGRNDGWHSWSAFDGYVKIFYLIDCPKKDEKTDDIKVDGSWGVKTTKKAQKVFKTTADGKVSDQPFKNQVLLPACSLESWIFWESKTRYKNGSELIKAMQEWLHKKGRYYGIIDGWCGETMIKGLQKFLKVSEKKKIGGVNKYVLGSETVKAFQKWLNSK